MARERENGEAARAPSLGQRLGAEMLGTGFLTFVAAGADVVDVTSGGGVGHVARYAAPALLVTAMIWCLSGVSGAHINPAVTFAFWLRGAFPAADVPAYVGAQLAGAVAAALVLRGIFGSAIANGVTHPLIVGPAQALAMEVLLTLLLVYTILATAEEQAIVGKNGALAVGSVVALCGFAFSPVCGASMNPARSLGPMVAALDLRSWWIYAAGPLAGAACAAAIALLTHPRDTRSLRRAAGGAP